MLETAMWQNKFCFELRFYLAYYYGNCNVSKLNFVLNLDFMYFYYKSAKTELQYVKIKFCFELRFYLAYYYGNCNASKLNFVLSSDFI